MTLSTTADIIKANNHRKLIKNVVKGTHPKLATQRGITSKTDEC